MLVFQGTVVFMCACKKTIELIALVYLEVMEGSGEDGLGIWAGVDGDVDFKHIEILLGEGPKGKGRDSEVPIFCAELAVFWPCFI